MYPLRSEDSPQRRRSLTYSRLWSIFIAFQYWPRRVQSLQRQDSVSVRDSCIACPSISWIVVGLRGCKVFCPCSGVLSGGFHLSIRRGVGEWVHHVRLRKTCHGHRCLSDRGLPTTVRHDNVFLCSLAFACQNALFIVLSYNFVATNSV